MTGLAGKVVIVTGAAQGIGKATAQALGREGARVVVCDIDLQGARNVAEEILAMGGEAHAFQVDVTCLEEINRMVAEVLAQWERIDGLVNNAGIMGEGKITELSENQWRKMLDVNLTSMFLCCKAVVPVMLQRGTGCIVNASSQVAFAGVTAGVHYAASKAGVVGLTRALAKELGPHGITVNAIAPGIILTRMNDGERLQRKQADWIQRLPLRRFGQPEEVADVIVFLLSDAARYITGETVMITGGMAMH